MTEEVVKLTLLDRPTTRKRARNVVVAALIAGSALGGVTELFAGPVGFLGVAAIVVVPIVALAYGESRTTNSLTGTELSARAFGVRTLDLATADKRDLLVVDIRGTRTVSLLLSGPDRNARSKRSISPWRCIRAQAE